MGSPYGTHIGMLAGNESWLTPDIKNSEIFLDSFDAVRKDRASDAHGGVFIAFKRDLLCIYDGTS